MRKIHRYIGEADKAENQKEIFNGGREEYTEKLSMKIEEKIMKQMSYPEDNFTT